MARVVYCPACLQALDINLSAAEGKQTCPYCASDFLPEEVGQAPISVPGLALNELESGGIPESRAYTVKQIAAATFLGSPLAGAWCMAANWRSWGKSRAAAFTLILGALFTLCSVGLAYALPEWTPNFLLPGLYVLAMYQAARAFQGKRLEDHLKEGGKDKSNWNVAGVGSGTLALVIVIIGGIFFFQPEDKITFGDSEVYYENGATKEDAKKAGNLLQDRGYFTNEGFTVDIGKTSRGYYVSFYVLDGAWNEADAVAYYRDFARMFSEDFGGKPVSIRLLDSRGSVKKHLD
jgi:hypothetical protein